MKTVLVLLSFILASGHLVHAQQGESIRRIGYLDTGFKPPKEFFDAIHKLGYFDGQNIIFENRSVEREERLTDLASDLVRRNVSVIVASGAAAGLAAQAATKTIPIVYLGGGDPVSLGLAGSLAHPGGNVTGITELSPELTAKRLELLKEAFPKISQVAVIAVRGSPGIAEQLETLERHGRGLGLKLKMIEIGGSGDIENSLLDGIKQGVSALIEVPNPLFHANSAHIVKFASQHKLPSIFHSRDFVEVGGLMPMARTFPNYTAALQVY